jgi:hypothetical protein
MGSSPSELLQLVRLHLLANSTVTTLVDERIHTTHFMDFDDVTRQLPAVILELAGGEMAYNQNLQSVSLFLYCYSAQNSAQTLELNQACKDALHAERLSHSSLTMRGMLEESTRPIQGYNDSVRAWYCRSTYLALTVG